VGTRNVLLTPWRGGTPRRLSKALNLVLRNPAQWEIDKNQDKTGVIINWGTSRVIAPTRGRLLNYPSHVAIAANKMATFRRLQEAKVPTLDWTRDPEEAKEWLQKHSVIGHWDLHGHSGHGLYHFPKGGDLVPKDDKGPVRVWTKYFPKKVECRIHLVKNPQTNKFNHIYVEKARISEQRREEFGITESPATFIRTYENGWIFKRQVVLDAKALGVAIQALEAVGLLFGAVDILVKDGEYRVGEINTAPGCEGEVLAFYCRNFTPYLHAA
jgi:hypothetical protein